MALTETRPETAVSPVVASGGVEPRTTPTAVERVLGSGDHAVVGRILIGASLLFLAIGLVITALSNLHLAAGDFLEESVGQRFALAHPLLLLFCGVLPLVLGLAFSIVPRQLGASTLLFPRAAAMSLWGWLFGAVLFLVSVFAKGSYGGSSLEMVRMGHVAIGLIAVSLLVGMVSVMTTIMSARPAGLGIARIPFTSFAYLVTGVLWLVTIPPFLAQIVLWHIRQPNVIDLTNSAYPQLTWIFLQPALYIAAIPLLGFLADSVATAAGTRQGGYGAMQALIVGFGVFSFGAWAQTEVSRDNLVWIATSVLVAVPVLGALGASLNTLRRGNKPVATAGLVAALLATLTLLLAIAAGAVQGIATAGDGELFDLARGDFATSSPGISTGQFYLVIGAVVVGGLGALFGWGSRIVDGGLPKGAGLGLVPLAALGALVMGLGAAIIGLTNAGDIGALATVSGIGALILGVTTLAALAALGAAATGRAGDNDDLVGGTLEWFDGAELPAIESEYPVLDLNEKGAN